MTLQRGPLRWTRRRARAARSPQLFVLGAAACFTALGWTYWLFVRTTTGQFADESAWAEADTAAPDGALPFLRFLDNLPLISVVIAAATLLFVTLVRRRWAAALLALGVMAGANLTTQILKNMVLDRPDRGVPTLDFNSLPSGHTTLAASAVAAVFLVSSPRWRPLVAAGGGTYSVLAGAATFVNLWHRPADVIAALLVVGAWTLLGGLLVMRTGNDWNVWPGFGRHWAASRWWLALCWVVGLAGLVLSALLYVLVQQIGPAPVPGTARVPLFFWAGLSSIVGTGFTLAGAAGWLFTSQARITGDRPHPNEAAVRPGAQG
ncbi:MAG: Phosphoesterase, PA-phosphatase related [uncultured Arthrobacter sp.]|uniref:Phosphoesterase, PA-phosphatase related n=1 Tax=uncultured Arthrobacter sp. TaxID=114050 RepID=A0A6J4IV40_9MICC|nr:phosphatase PAP2 family protein [uncultured Arthrobacter sp.]CAA9260737.1 MAG: Phosphoesterase, PA-phosphatase related [uncultured Arthrobacter sp.]